MIFPPLYKKSKTGAIVLCQIHTNDNIYTVTTGQVNGAMREFDTVCIPMNVGRSNETTGEQQAEKEALAKWTKKIKTGYVEDPAGVTEVRLPMKVKKYQDNVKNVIFPCFGSPKLNGVNGLYRLEDKLNLYSRGGNLYPEIPHLDEEIKVAMELLQTKELNGELYIEGEPLQKIQSATSKTKPLSKKLIFYVFEIPDNGSTYENKLKLLNSVDNSKFQFVKIVRSKILNDHSEIEEYLHERIARGDEGIVIRNKRLVYKYNIRSSDIFKYKLPQDGEFKIVSWRADKNNHPVFRCKISDEFGGHEFNVKIKGSDEERADILKEANDWVGKWLKIEYEELTLANKPSKPVGICLRNCDVDGEVME